MSICCLASKFNYSMRGQVGLILTIIMKKTIMSKISNKYSSFVFWAWNDFITCDGIDKQLKQFADVGIGGVVIHARAGLKIEYMSEEWFGLIVFAVRKAKQFGLKVMIYDENGWPSGFANGAVVKADSDFSMKKLYFSIGKPCSDEVLYSYKKDKNCYAFGGNDLFVCVKRNYDYVDLTDRRVTEKFIELTHEKYKKVCGDEFGKTIIAVFTDEPQYSSLDNYRFPYSEGMEDEFFSFCGLDLKDNLWRLYAERNGRFKRIYLEFFAKRFEKNYTAVVADWCEKNHLEMTGHFSAEDGIVSEACGSGGVMPHYRLMQRPGIDYLGRRFASPVLLKQVESVKNQSGKGIVLSESFGGAGWGSSLKDYMRIWSYQAAFGINQLCVHLSPYSISGVRKRDYPGFFSDVQPWWCHADVFFERIERLNELLSSGKARNRVAVLHPLLLAFGMENFSPRQKELSTQFRLLTENLLDCQIDFDYIDEQAIISSSVKDGKLFVGECEYELILAIDGTIEKRIKNKIFKVKTGIVGRDLFNRRNDIMRWFDYIGYRRRVIVSDEDGILRGLIVSYKQSIDKSFAYIFNKDGNTENRACLAGDFSSVKEISLNGNEKSLSVVKCEKGAFCYIDIPHGEAKTYVFMREKISNSCVKKEEELSIKRAELKDRNCLTIDKASYSFNGKDYSTVNDIIKIASKIYAHGGEVFVKYTFVSRVEGAKISLHTENGYTDILVNGCLPEKNREVFLSEALLSYDISSLVVKGENSIVMRYKIPENVDFCDEWNFESARNIYYLPVEPESVYLTGDFSVNCNIVSVTDDYLKSDGNFFIDRKRPIKASDITGSGAPFYRGRADIFSEIEYEDGEAYLCADFFGSVAELFVNGKSAGCLFDGDKSNVTSLLVKGKNEIKLVLYSTNRNLLGAHHHVCGEVRMTGRNTFEGKRGFEDFVNPSAPQNTYVETYSFISFGVKRLTFITEKKYIE